MGRFRIRAELELHVAGRPDCGSPEQDRPFLVAQILRRFRQRDWLRDPAEHKPLTFEKRAEVLVETTALFEHASRPNDCSLVRSVRPRRNRRYKRRGHADHGSRNEP